MKKYLLTLTPALLLFCYSFSQSADGTTKKYKKEIALSYVFIYPGNFLPSVEFTISKVVSPGLHFGLGISELYFRYKKSMYVPVFTHTEIYFGKKKRVGLNLQGGFSFFNYKWNNGNVFIEEKGNFYISAGPKYAFNIKNTAINCSFSLVIPQTKETVTNKTTQSNSTSINNNSGMNLKIGFPF